MATQSRSLFAWISNRLPFFKPTHDNRNTSKRTSASENNSNSKLATEAISALAKSTLATRCATVIIPALNEEKQIASVVRYALADPATAKVIVIDDSSIDNTVALAQEAGATVYTSSMLGKGASMKDGLAYVDTPFVVYLDGDLAGLEDSIVTRICQPLINDEADFVKAKFGRSSGRVTELTAKPMIRVFFPELATFSQPLGGIIAARHRLLNSLNFEDGYGVDIGLLIDAHLAQARLAQVDIGSLEHDSQALDSLALMAVEIGRVIFHRAKKAGRLNVDQITAMYELQRQSSGEIDFLLSRRGDRKKLFLLCMNGTVINANYAYELARACGQLQALDEVEKSNAGDPTERAKAIAKVFQYVHKKKFEEVASNIALRTDVIALVNQLRRQGFMVGVVTEGYNIAAEITRRRVFADFAVGHLIEFEHEVCTGNVKLNAAFLDPAKPDIGPVCKSNVLRHFLDDTSQEKIETTWAMGNQINDLPLLRLADKAMTIAPNSTLLAKDSRIEQYDSFAKLLAYLKQTDAETYKGLYKLNLGARNNDGQGSSDLNTAAGGIMAPKLHAVEDGLGTKRKVYL
jgi:glucosyl-3-phosphoglycerate synthase